MKTKTVVRKEFFIIKKLLTLGLTNRKANVENTTSYIVAYVRITGSLEEVCDVTILTC